MRFVIILLGLLILSCQDQESTVSEYDLKTWLRKTPVEIGCLFETKLLFRDTIFNCSYENYTNKGDPCTNTTAYYEGVAFPNKFAHKIHPTVEGIDLEFEHGNLRQIMLTFKDSIHKDNIRKLFNLPKNRAHFPSNIMKIRYGDNVSAKEKPLDSTYTKWLSIVGFDHMGAGDVDCN